MGIIKKIKNSYKNSQIEKKDFGNPEPREPLSNGLVSALNNPKSGNKKAPFIVGSVVFTILIVGLVGWSFYRVYGPNAESETTNSDISVLSSGSSTAESEYYKYFNNLNAWSFCNVNRNEFANKVYSKLLEMGIQEKSIVYCYSDVVKSGDLNVAYMRESASSRYFQMIVESDFSITIKEIIASDLPSASDTEQVEKEKAEREARKAEQEANDKSNKNDTTTTNSDLTNTTGSVLVTDKDMLKKCLPEECAEMASTSLINGIKETYGFNAEADISVIRPETITQNGSNYTFVAQFLDKDRNGLNVEVTYNKDDGSFSGKKIV